MKKVLLNRLAILLVSFYVGACAYNEIQTRIDCIKSDLAISLLSKSDATSCKSIDGQITMSAIGGAVPYDFSLGDGIYQTKPVFDRLAPGSYLVTVKDFNGCKRSEQVNVGAKNSTLNATPASTPDTDCFLDNGTITITPTGGDLPYLFKIDNGIFGSASTFSSQSNGNHTVIVKDAQDCQMVLIVNVPRANTGISYANVIVPIFTASCNFDRCHGAGSTGRDWTKFPDVKAKAADIKSRTGNRSMPIGNNGPALTAQQIQQIACWVDDGANNN